MIFVMTMVAFCLIPMVWGLELDKGGDILRMNSEIILDLQLRLSAIELLHIEETLRISDLANQQQTDQSRISDLEKQRQIDQRRIADLAKQRQIDQRRIADLAKQRQIDQHRISDLENVRNGDQRLITNDLEQQQRHRKLDLIHKTTSNSFANNATLLGDERRSPFVMKTGPNSIKKTLAAPALETTNRGIQKRVSSDNAGIVAFYAYLTHDYTQVAKLMEIHFDRVTTNLGGSYSGNTGTFTCTNAGVYVFSWTVHVYPRYAYIELVKNGVVAGTTFSGDSQYSGAGGGSVVLQLDQGDEVWVRAGDHQSIQIFGSRGTTMFSGFLLQ